MKKNIKVDSKELGLAIGLIFGKYFMKTQHLHYGYWSNGLELDISNVSRAQENYCDFVISKVPEGTGSILDVGCGTGALAEKLMKRGFEVDCVSPSPFLTRYVRDLLGDASHIYQCGYEQLETGKRYDLVLFSESFQYIDPKQSIKKSLEVLKEGGHMLICDFFRKDTDVPSYMGGGHNLKEFYELVANSPLTPLEDIDITDKTAPNIDLARDIFDNFGHPAWNLITYYLESNYPKISRFLKYRYRKKIDKIERKYFSGGRNAENFKATKSYRLLCYSK